MFLSDVSKTEIKPKMDRKIDWNRICSHITVESKQYYHFIYMYTVSTVE